MLWKVPFLLYALAKTDVFSLTWNTATQICCQVLLAGGSPWGTDYDKPLLAHLSGAQGPIFDLLHSLGMESNPASCQRSHVLSYLRHNQDRGDWQREVSRAKNKGRELSPLFQLRYLKTLKCEAKSCLMLSCHWSWSCKIWTDYSPHFPR